MVAKSPPRISEVLAAPIPTLRHIPSACRRIFANLLGQILIQLTKSPTWQGVLQLVSLAKLTLRAPRKRSMLHPKRLTEEVTRRLLLFEAGQISQLWDEVDLAAPTGPRRSTRVANRRPNTEDIDTLPDSVINTIRGLAEEGAFSKATRHLVSEGLADVSDPAVLTKLRELHPTGTPVTYTDSLPATCPDCDLPGEPEEWEHWCLQAIARFPTGSAPGPSGLRPSHLKDCIRKAGSTQVLRQ